MCVQSQTASANKKKQAVEQYETLWLEARKLQLVAIYREAKQHVGPRYFISNVVDFGRIVSAKCNANGTRVSIIVDKVCLCVTYLNTYIQCESKKSNPQKLFAIFSLVVNLCHSKISLVISQTYFYNYTNFVSLLLVRTLEF